MSMVKLVLVLVLVLTLGLRLPKGLRGPIKPRCSATLLVLARYLVLAKPPSPKARKRPPLDFANLDYPYGGALCSDSWLPIHFDPPSIKLHPLCFLSLSEQTPC